MAGEHHEDQRRPLREMPWWAVVVAALVIATATTAITVWLWSIADNSAQLRIEAIKSGLTFGAGGVGVVALLLAGRRQWLNERAQAHAEDVARDTMNDAIQRRVTELFGQAVEQLGHDQAAVRMGGLYSLERLAQDHHEHRQTVIDVVCAYLRMAFALPADMAEAAINPTASRDTPPLMARLSDSGSHQELQVRLAAQHILARHLKDTPDEEGESNETPETHWAGMRIDLSGALLIDFNLSHCRTIDANFNETYFFGDTKFYGATFDKAAHFERAWFHGDAMFGQARFGGQAHFEGTHGPWRPTCDQPGSARDG